MSQIPLRVTAARGGCKKRVLFSSQSFMLEAENSLYPQIMQASVPARQRVGVTPRDGMGYSGRDLGLFVILNM